MEYINIISGYAAERVGNEFKEVDDELTYCINRNLKKYKSISESLIEELDAIDRKFAEKDKDGRFLWEGEGEKRALIFSYDKNEERLKERKALLEKEIEFEFFKLSDTTRLDKLSKFEKEEVGKYIL